MVCRQLCGHSLTLQDHGVKRQKTVDESAEVIAARRAKDAKRIEAYRAATADLYRRVRSDRPTPG